MDRFFNPRAIAVIGASQDLATISGQPVPCLKSHGYPGAVYPVNPKYEELAGYKCYPSVLDLPETPDLVFLLVNAARVPAMLRQCGEKGIPFVMISSSGFSEIGGEGVKLQQEVMEIAKQYPIHIVGPNSQGMMNIPDRVYVGFGYNFQQNILSGQVSLVSQSGGLGYGTVNLAEEAGLGFRYVVGSGNEADVSTTEFMQCFIEDPHTEIVAAIVEGLKDAHRLLEVGELALQRNKPILIWKVGNTELGEKVAATHTANLSGNTALYQAAFKQKGMIPLEDVQDLVDYGKAFLCGKRPLGNKVAILTASGGAGVVFADLCLEMGLEVPPLTTGSQQRMKDIVPSFGTSLNPIDLTGRILTEPDMLFKALQMIAEDPQVDSLAVIVHPLPGKLAAQFAAQIVELNRRTDKPIFISWGTRDRLAQEAYALLDEAKIPRYKTPVRCGKSLCALHRFAEARRRGEKERREKILMLERPEARRLLKGQGESVSEYAAKKVLQQYGIPITLEELASNKEEARVIAERLGYPVVMKVQSPDILHKTEAKAVRLGISSAEELHQAYDEILRNAKAYKPNARVEGVLIQEMVQGGVECVLGLTNDPMFGPAVMFGLGGIFVEVLKDAALRLSPVTRSVAMEMIREIKGYPVLEGVRGKFRADIEALADTLIKLSALAIDLKDEVAELDINPLFVFEEGKGVKAGDALIKKLRSSSPGPSSNG